MPKKSKNVQFYEGIGRRKRSVARVRLYLATKEKPAVVGTLKIKAGECYLNSKPFDKAVTISYERDMVMAPLKLTGNEGRFALSIRTEGGGRNGQLEAMVLGISRALELVDREEYRPTLKKQGFLKRDPRKRQRRRVGTGGKARRVKQSPKR